MMIVSLIMLKKYNGRVGNLQIMLWNVAFLPFRFSFAPYFFNLLRSLRPLDEHEYD